MKENHIQNKKKEEKKLSSLQIYGKYSGIGFQMVVIVCAGVFGGHYLDKLLHLAHPIFTLILSLIAIFIAIYSAVREFLK